MRIKKTDFDVIWKEEVLFFVRKHDWNSIENYHKSQMRKLMRISKIDDVD